MQYEVQYGESPATIARKFGASMGALIAANPQKPTTVVAGVRTWRDLRPGEVVSVPVGGYVGDNIGVGDVFRDAALHLNTIPLHTRQMVMEMLRTAQPHHGEQGVRDAMSAIREHAMRNGGGEISFATAKSIGNALRAAMHVRGGGLLGAPALDLLALDNATRAARGWQLVEGGTFVNRHGIHADRWGRPIGHGHPRPAPRRGLHGLGDGTLGDAASDAVNALMAAGSPCNPANVGLVCAAQAAMGLGVDGKWGGGTASAAQAIVSGAPGACSPRPSWWKPAGQVNCPPGTHPAPAVTPPSTSSSVSTTAAAALAALTADSNYCASVRQSGTPVNTAVHNFKAAWNAANPSNPVPIGTGNYEASVATALSSALGGQTVPPGCGAAAPSAPPPSAASGLPVAASMAVAALSADPNYCTSVGRPGTQVNTAIHNFKVAWNAANPSNPVPIGTGKYEPSVAVALQSVAGGTVPPGCGAPPHGLPPSPPPGPPPSPPPGPPPSPPPGPPPSPPPGPPPSPPPGPPPGPPPSPPPGPPPSAGPLWPGGPPAGLTPQQYAQWAIAHPADVSQLISLSLLPAGWAPPPVGGCPAGQVYNPMTGQCLITGGLPPGPPPSPPPGPPPSPPPGPPGPIVKPPEKGGISTGAIVAGAIGAVALVGVIAAASMAGKGKPAAGGRRPARKAARKPTHHKPTHRKPARRKATHRKTARKGKKKRGGRR